MLVHGSMPDCYWAAAAQYAAEVENMMLPRSLSDFISCYESFFGHKPQTEMLRTFGCLAYVHIDKLKRISFHLSDRAVVCVFLGFGFHLGRKAYMLGSLDHKHIYFATRSVTFNEEIFPYRMLNKDKHRWDLP